MFYLKGGDLIGIWNYRVLKEQIIFNNQKLDSFRVIEVYYKEDATIEGWADCTTSILHVVEHPYDEDDLKGDGYDDLKTTAHHVLDAFKLPMVALKEDKSTLYELDK